MMRALFSGMSGLAINMNRMDVIGNNVANVNTVGYKQSRVTFEEHMTQLIQGATAPFGNLGGSNPKQIGNGARLGTIDMLFTQGSLESTGIDTDLAIQGRAFFVLSNGTDRFYSRAGSFQLDGNGQLVNPSNGYTLQGYAFNRITNQYATLPGSVRVPLGETEPAKATSLLTYRGNLDADSEPQGTISQSAIMYSNTGSPASASDLLVNLRGDPAGIVTLVEAGDEISFSTTVNGIPASGSLRITSGTRVSDLLSAMENAMNGVEGVSGVSVSMNQNGRIHLTTPDSLGTGGEVRGLVIQAADSIGVPRHDFNGLSAMTEIQAARDASVFIEESTIYDSLGFSHVVRLEFTRVLGANQFTWEATVDGGDTPILAGRTGTVTFNADGSFNGFFFDAVGEMIPTSLSISPTTGAQTPLEITLDAGVPGGFAGVTLVRSPGNLEATGDGFSKGTAVDFRIDRDGTVISIFSNGVTRPAGRLALAEFVNPTGLMRFGDNMYQQTVNSGDPLMGTAAGAIEAAVFSGSLEQSNVDLSRQFTDMILAQRGFQANARMITTSDDVLAELLNLKR